MAAWENVLGVVASILQISGVDVVMLLILVGGALKLRSCKLERTKLKHLASELDNLGGLPTAQCAEQVLKAAGLWEKVQLAIDTANRLVQAYDSSSVFHMVCYSWRMQREMLGARRRVSNCYDLAVGVHAGVAVGRHTAITVGIHAGIVVACLANHHHHHHVGSVYAAPATATTTSPSVSTPRSAWPPHR